MQTLKLVVSLGGLSAPTVQNLQVSDHSSGMVMIDDCKVICVTDDNDYQPPVFNQISTRETVTLPKIMSRQNDLQPVGSARRLVRQHFAQHQHLFWQSFTPHIPNSADKNTHVILLVDCENLLASSICWDVLYQIRLNYPNVVCNLLFFVPANPLQLSETSRLNVAALLAEYNAIAQKSWIPISLQTQQPYLIDDMALWDASFLHELPPPSQIGFDYYQLVEQVVSLPQQKMGTQTFAQAIKEDFPKRNDKNKKVMPPRILSLMKASVQMDMTATQKLLTQNIQVCLLQLLLQPNLAQKYSLQTHGSLLQDGWILDEAHLLLNKPLDVPFKVAHESIETEWQKRGDFFVQQVQEMKKLSWKEKADELQSLFQKAYDKYFRTVGVEQYYSLSQSRLERLSETQGGLIEAKIWNKCFQGEYDLNRLCNQIPQMLSYYILLQEKFELHQRRMNEEFLVQQSIWQETLESWQSSGRRERTRIEQTSMAELGGILQAQYVLQCHYKAFSFAIKLIDVLMPKYQGILNAVDGIKKLWQKQEQGQSAALKKLEEAHQSSWVSRNSQHGNHQYLLQPTSNTTQYLLREFVVDLGDWVPEMVTTWTKRFGEQGDFTQLLTWMQQGQWFALLERISAQISYRLSVQTPKSGVNPLSLMFEQRLTELTQLQIQQLSKHINDSIVSHYKQQWTPLGKVLTEHYRSKSSTAIVCSLDLQNPEAQTVVLWMKEVAKRANPNVVVVPTSSENQIQMLIMTTTYLQEWTHLKPYLKTYQKYVNDDNVLEFMHIDGSAAQLRHASLQFTQRNLDLVRQQLLLAKISGHLIQNQAGFSLNVGAEGTVKQYQFETDDLGYLAETISLHVVRQLVEQNRVLRQRSPESETAQWNCKLDDVLAQMRQLYVPEGMDLADMDWKDAGKYVVWTRSVQNLRKYWLPQYEMENFGAATALSR